MNDLFKRGKIFDRTGKHDTVEQLIVKNPRPDISMYEPEIRIVAEHSRSLLQLRKIYIKTRHLRSGNFRKLMGKPPRPAANLQDPQRLVPRGQGIPQALRRPLPDLPFPAMWMVLIDI